MEYRYTGQLRQAELGLYTYVARWYDPTIAHFVQADSIVPGVGEARAFDRYAYVQWNPIRYMDPSGHVFIEGTGGGGVSNEILKETWKKEAVEIADDFLEKREKGTTVAWNGLSWRDKYILEKGDYNEEIYNDHIRPAVSEADPLHDPAVWLALLPVFIQFVPSVTLSPISPISVGTASSCAAINCSTRIGSTGEIGEQFVSQLGGQAHVYFPTSSGRRYIDLIINGMAYESKVGYATLTERISLQIAKDVELLTVGEVKSITWVFFTSPITGLRGPSEPLYQLLTQNGIKVLFGP